jgi:hypothetical protein
MICPCRPKKEVIHTPVNCFMTADDRQSNNKKKKKNENKKSKEQ